jgi:hypothetical protein
VKCRFDGVALPRSAILICIGDSESSSCDGGEGKGVGKGIGSGKVQLDGVEGVGVAVLRVSSDLGQGEEDIVP